MGKGSGRRKFNKQSEEAYRNNPYWDSIEREKKRQLDEGRRRAKAESRC